MYLIIINDIGICLMIIDLMTLGNYLHCHRYLIITQQIQKLMKSDLQPPWSRDTTLSFSQNRASYSEPTCRVVIE